VITMANDNYYDVRNHVIVWNGPETAFRTNSEGKDTANLAGDTFWRLPGRLLRVPYTYIKRNKAYSRVANTKFWGYIGHEGFQEGKMTLTLDMIDLSMMYYLCKACSTNDGAAPVYVHTYATTTAQTSPPPSFQMLYKIENYEAGNNIVKLFTGCVLSGVAISIPEDGPVQLTLDIKFANVITGLALTSNIYPGFGTLKNYTIDRTEITIKKNGTDYPGAVHSADIVYNDGTVLDKPANELYASEAINGNPDIQVSLAFAPKDHTFAADTLTAPLAPAVASHIDIVIKMYRGDDDYTEFNFEKVWCIDSADGTWDFELESAIMLQFTTTFIVKPAAFETGAKLPNPLIIAKGASAVGAATKGAAAGAAKIAASDKAAKALGGAFKSIEETTKMGGFQSLENFSQNIKQLGPVASAFEVLGAQFTAGTMESQINLMTSLLDLFMSDHGQNAIKAAAELVSILINGTADIIRLIDKVLELLSKEPPPETGLETYPGAGLIPPPRVPYTGIDPNESYSGGEQQLF